VLVLVLRPLGILVFRWDVLALATKRAVRVVGSLDAVDPAMGVAPLDGLALSVEKDPQAVELALASLVLIGSSYAAGLR
jgi:hypothetical protein